MSSKECKIFGWVTLIVGLFPTCFLVPMLTNANNGEVIPMIIALLVITLCCNVVSIMNIVRGIVIEENDKKYNKLIVEMGQMMLAAQKGEKKLLNELREELIKEL